MLTRNYSQLLGMLCPVALFDDRGQVRWTTQQCDHYIARRQGLMSKDQVKDLVNYSSGKKVLYIASKQSRGTRRRKQSV